MDDNKIIKVKEGRRFDTFTSFFVLTPDGVSDEFYEIMNINYVADYPNSIRIHDVNLGVTGAGAPAIEHYYAIGTIIDKNNVPILPKTVGTSSPPMPIGNITNSAFINVIRWNTSDKKEYSFINGSPLCNGIQMQRLALKTSRVLSVGEIISFQLCVEFEIPE